MTASTPASTDRSSSLPGGKWIDHAKRRPAVVAGGIGLVAALAIVIASQRKGELTPLLTIPAAEFRTANRAWQQAGLTGAEYRDGQAFVPCQEVEAYRQALPATKSGSSRGGNGWADLWQSASDRLGQFSGAHERQTALDLARAQALSRLLSDLPDVANADVVWDESPATGWREPPRVRATVYLKAREGSSIGPQVVDSVRRAVAGSKANLKAEDVVVMDQTSGVVYDGAALDPQLAQAATQSAWLQGRIVSALNHVQGVQVSVDLQQAGAATNAGVRTASRDDGAGGALPSAAVGTAVVSVSVPEGTIRTLAGLNASAAGSDGRRREVYQSVERHLHASIAERVTRLIPLEWKSAGPQVFVDTIPSPPAAVVATRQPDLASVLPFLKAHSLLLVGIACGVAAAATLASLLRGSRSRSMASARSQSAVEPMAKEVRREPVAADANPMAALMAATAEQSALETETAGASYETSEPEQPAVVYSGRRRNPGRDVLADVLQRITAREEAANRASEAVSPRSVATTSQEVTALAQPKPAAHVNRLTSSMHPSPTPTHIESLVGENVSLLRELASAIEVDTWGHALAGASTALQAQILPHLPPAAANRLTEQLRASRPLRLRDIDTAQTEVLRVWSSLREPAQAGEEVNSTQ